MLWKNEANVKNLPIFEVPIFDVRHGERQKTWKFSQGPGKNRYLRDFRDFRNSRDFRDFLGFYGFFVEAMAQHAPGI